MIQFRFTKLAPSHPHNCFVHSTKLFHSIFASSKCFHFPFLRLRQPKRKRAKSLNRCKPEVNRNWWVSARDEWLRSRKGNLWHFQLGSTPVKQLSLAQISFQLDRTVGIGGETCQNAVRVPASIGDSFTGSCLKSNKNQPRFTSDLRFRMIQSNQFNLIFCFPLCWNLF